ncbi:MAG: hypothetical protein KGH61_03690 [Candidatus Micrarchaeota archaeon]|nr:hypothetical protein [Candidatus Micrarchaeota archaeon]MDE1848024.1 hypothetical protein [Candidatus Micrarchaeota archaeon]MDE1864599.1 hypothetical protein [Candidatus Micrarchaeota archaeon]
MPIRPRRRTKNFPLGWSRIGEFNVENTEVAIVKRSVRTDPWAQDKMNLVGFVLRDRKADKEVRVTVSEGTVRMFGLGAYETRDQINVHKSKTDKVFEANSLVVAYEGALEACKAALEKVRSRFNPKSEIGKFTLEGINEDIKIIWRYSEELKVSRLNSLDRFLA